MANFSSLNFILRFLPAFLLIYYIVPRKAKKVVSIVGSLVFYGYGDIIFLPMIVGLALINHTMGAASYEVDRLKSIKIKDKERRKSLLLALVIDISVLLLFKILTLFFEFEYWPLGLSFYIFKMISYQVDICNRTIAVKPTLLESLDYFLLFPQVSQGPIMRYSDYRPNFAKDSVWLNIEKGLKIFVAGFAMKTILADRIGILWNDLGMYGYDSISTPLAWMGAFAYSFELYFDFWGYSLMASGIMVAMGYEFVENFKNPYAARTVSEFYRRWHITLGTFFRDYVYFPLGGSHCNKVTMVRNLALVWLLTGLWHGNGLNFLVWGIVLGGLIIVEKLFCGRFLAKTFLGNIYVSILIPITWVIFVSDSVSSLMEYLKRLFPFWGSASYVNNLDVIDYIKNYWILFVLAIVLCIPPIVELIRKVVQKWYGTVILIIIFWIGAYYSASGAVNPFMYLNF